MNVLEGKEYDLSESQRVYLKMGETEQILSPSWLNLRIQLSCGMGDILTVICEES